MPRLVPHHSIRLLAAAAAILAYTQASYAEVVLKMMVVNPSETETKEYDIKSPLPPEVKPEHILDSDGLKVEYDSQEGGYFLSGHVTLKPKESLTKQVVLEDVWLIPAERFSSLRREMEDIMRKLQFTPYYERGEVLSKAVERRLIATQESQEESVNAPPMQHINQYRENIKTLDQVETDMVSLRQLMVMAALNPSAQESSLVPADSGASSQSGHDQGSPLSVTNTWRLILIILGLLGFVSLSFFLVWQRQLKLQLAKQAGERNEQESPVGQGKAADPSAMLDLPPMPPSSEKTP